MALVVASLAWLYPTRTIRAQVLTTRERAYIQIARLSGSSGAKIIVWEIMPNLLPYLAATFVGTVSAAILASIGLEILGLGVIEACPPRDVAAKSPVAIRHIKRALNTIEELPVRDAYRFEQSVTVELSHTEDAREAQRAFVEKRKPVFKGR